MNRTKVPCCNGCKKNYQVGDTRGPNVPLLLKCGHDMCRSCLKFMYKKNKQITCEVCHDVDKNVEYENQTINLPIHYYLVGKVYCIMLDKQKQIHRDISNLRITDMPNKFLENSNGMCRNCHNYANYYCEQCGDKYCVQCFDEIHKENQVMIKHQKVALNTGPHLELPQESRCDQHLKIIDFICETCQSQICSICAIETHRQHVIHPLDKYKLSTAQRLNEYSLKGERLLEQLKHCRDKFNVKMLKSQNTRKKANNTENIKKNVTLFVSSAIGALQLKEHNLFKMLNEAELTKRNSINSITNQLNVIIEDLKIKLNKIHLLCKNSQYSSNMLDTVTDIERFLDTTYYVAKKVQSKPSIVCDNKFFDSIQECITVNVDVASTYMLGYTPQFPSDYVISSTIEVVNDVITQRSASVQSTVSTLSSNFSIVSSVETNQDLVTHETSLVKGITKNVVESVIVTYLNSPSDFYLQLRENSTILFMICDELNQFVRTECSAVEHIKMENEMYAVNISSNEWCRGVVTHIYEKDGNTYYTIHCIDFGFMETLTACKIKSVPPSVSLIPPLAYNCALYNLKPSVLKGWSNEACVLFKKLMSEKTGTFFMYPIETDGERYEVDVVWKEDIYPLSIRDAMFFLGHCAYEFFDNGSLHDEELINTLTLPDILPLKEGEEYPVILSHFITPYEFYIRIVKEDDYTLEESMKLLETVYKPTEINTHISYLLYTPRIGMAVAARYSIDGNWYRAKITSLPEPRMVTVFYVDFGNSETLQWDQLRVLDRRFIVTPPHAIKASLAGVIPAEHGMECSKWNDNACATFLDLLDSCKNINNNLSVIINEVDRNTHKVVMLNHTSRGVFCVNNKLVTQGHAVPLNQEFFVCNKLYNEEIRRKAVKSTVSHPNIRNKNKIMTSEDTLAFIKQRSVVESRNHSWQKSKKNNDAPGIKMLVVKVDSPDKIVLKHDDHSFAKLTERMNKEYAGNETKKVKKFNWLVNDKCAAFIHKFGNWYRGKILKVDAENKNVSVHFYDIDVIYDDMSIHVLYVLDKIFSDEKSSFLYCGMSDLIPLGTSNGNWAQFSCDRLIEEMKKHPYVYFLKKERVGDKILGEIWVKEIDVPQALEPLRENWINMNTFMIEQGFAMSKKQNKKDDDVYSSSKSDSEIDNVIEKIEDTKSSNCWLPPVPILETQFNAVPSYIDMQCHLYLQIQNKETNEALTNVSDKLMDKFSDSEPEPINFKWFEGQMVIARYHLDRKWYRGTIIEVKKNKTYTVHYLDYGNNETCSHNDLRSTLCLTDIPQLCVKGYLSGILPMTKDGKWTVDTLDVIHSLVVEKPCTVTVDLKISTGNMYSIKSIVLKGVNVYQHLVTEGHAYFEYVDVSNLELSNNSRDEIKENCTDKSDILSSLSSDFETNGHEHSSQNAIDDTEETGFMEFCLLDETVEGILCNVIEPTQVMLVITKIDGVDISEAKNDMHSIMLKTCCSLPMLDKIIPGSSVVVLQNSLWRRGIVMNEHSVFLVDVGKFVKLVSKNVRLCPPEFLELPMYTVKCHLVNVEANKNCDPQDVVEHMSQSLKNVNLKIVAIRKVNDTVDVELYNDKGEIAYQSLIDSKQLIPSDGFLIRPSSDI